MGKIYCTECGAELDDSVKFCSNCGTKIEDGTITSDFNENTDDNNVSGNNSNKINTSPKKSSEIKYSNTAKILLGIAGLCIILFVIGIVLIGSSLNTSIEDSNSNEDNSDQTFIENIYGINFAIPSYFKAVESKDYEDDGTGTISCTRTYERPDGTGIAIVVVTSPDGWNLDNDVTGIDMTVNGHHGKLSSARDVFGYISGDKLVVISGTSQEEVEDIIIE